MEGCIAVGKLEWKGSLTFLAGNVMHLLPGGVFPNSIYACHRSVGAWDLASPLYFGSEKPEHMCGFFPLT